MNDKNSSSTNGTTHQTIQEINDAFRASFVGGTVMVTDGIIALGLTAQKAIVAKVRTFNNFTPDNDPYGEHDFGSFLHEGERIIFKIDYYDQTLTMGSDDPSNGSITRRVLTILLANEW